MYIYSAHTFPLYTNTFKHTHIQTHTLTHPPTHPHKHTNTQAQSVRRRSCYTHAPPNTHTPVTVALGSFSPLSTLSFCRLSIVVSPLFSGASDYIRICIYTCVYIYVDVFVWMCMRNVQGFHRRLPPVPRGVRIYIYIYVCVCIYIYTYMCIHIYVCICMYTQAFHSLVPPVPRASEYICIYVYKCVYICVNAYICMCMYIYAGFPFLCPHYSPGASVKSDSVMTGRSLLQKSPIKETLFYKRYL